MSIKKIDNYRIRLNEILGVNGNTFIGYNNISKQEVVIKVLNKSEIAKKYHNNLQSFKKKVRFLHKIRKSASYVVRYLNLLETHNHFYIIQQLCKGGNLKKVLSQKKLSTTEAFKYMRHILKGFLQLIKKGIFHGNLTPSNILSHNGLMKLADFGLSPNKIAQSVESQIKNTVYMAPQVLIGKNYTQKSDIWSLGLIFYEMIYGMVPWKTGGSIKTYMQRLQNEPLQFPSQPEISPQLKNLIKGCLYLDPGKRLYWQQIYLNDVFNNEFIEIESIDIKLGYTLGKLRRSLNLKNLSLQRYLEDQMVTNETILDFVSFQHIMSFIDQSLDIQELKYLFNVFDSNQTKMIEFISFRNAMQHYDIPFEYQPLRKKSKKKLENYQHKHSPTKQLKQDILQRGLQKLIKQMKQHKINDLQTILSHQQKELHRLMNYIEFSILLRKIQPRLTEDQCRAIHKKIDVNSDGKISYQQFLQSINMFTGLPNKYSSKMVFMHRKSF